MINTIITGQAARRSQSMSIATLFTCCIKGNKVCVVAGRRSFDGLKLQHLLGAVLLLLLLLPTELQRQHHRRFLQIILTS
mmetsp:Transcript_55954/g.62628  ORF Transcript_55954/g.62628 Transcript_55954/m.62628 type:complete len:80 (+) Transcript_55954:173-412(+)